MDSVEAGWAFLRDEFSAPEVLDSFAPLAEHCPDAFVAYVALREAVSAAPPHGALEAKTTQLILIAMACMARKSNPPPVVHARKAVEAGATLREVAQVVALCISVGGMVTYQESGQWVLKAAEEAVHGFIGEEGADD